MYFKYVHQPFNLKKKEDKGREKDKTEIRQRNRLMEPLPVSFQVLPLNFLRPCCVSNCEHMKYLPHQPNKIEYINALGHIFTTSDLKESHNESFWKESITSVKLNASHDLILSIQVYLKGCILFCLPIKACVHCVNIMNVPATCGHILKNVRATKSSIG